MNQSMLKKDKHLFIGKKCSYNGCQRRNTAKGYCIYHNDILKNDNNDGVSADYIYEPRYKFSDYCNEPTD